MIHPTALVQPGAQLGAECEIGPFCVIGSQVVLGDRCRLHAHVVLDGHTELGHDNEVFPFASIGLKTQDLKWQGGVTRTRIGDHNTIRESVTIHSATGDGEATVIGSQNHILAYTHIGHNVVLGNRIIISMAGLAGHVLVEDHAVIGGMTFVHQFSRIGTMAIVGGCSKVVRDVAPYMLIDGNPAQTVAINKIGLDRNHVSAETQAALKQAHRLLFRTGLTVPNALARIETEVPALPEVQHLIEFIRASERGIIR